MKAPHTKRPRPAPRRASPKLAPKPRFADPRKLPSRLREGLPQAAGRPAARLDAHRRNDRIQLEFVAAYAALNGEYRRLLEIRADRKRAGHAARERAQLRRIERALRRRDALEDHYAPLGVIAEPILREGFAVDLKFTFGNMTEAGEPRGTGVCVFSAQVPLPLPADYPLTEVTRGVIRALRALD